MLESDGQGSQFFRDQNVFEQDLNNIEYTKTKLVRDTTAQTMFSSGVCCIDKGTDTALKVTASFTDITIAPGSAVDELGRLITVPVNTAASGSVTSDPYYHPAWPDAIITHTAGNGTFNVYITYTTQEGLPEVDDDGESHNSRIYDSYEITLVSTVISGPTHGILLAEYDVSSGDIQKDDIIDSRTLYSAATPATVDISSHMADFHTSGIGDIDFLDYSLSGSMDAEADDYYKRSLGFKIYNNLGGAPIHSRLQVRPTIDTYVNLNGHYLIGALVTDDVEWDNTDDTSGYYIVYVDADKTIHRSDRADTVNGTFNLPTDAFPICKLYWDVLVVPRDLSLITDMRFWGTTKGEIGGAQFNSGSLTINRNLTGIDNNGNHLTDATLYFVDEDRYIKYDSIADHFYMKGDTTFEWRCWFSSHVKIALNCNVAGAITVNNGGDGVDGGDGVIGFYDGGDDFGKTLTWADVDNRFEFNGHVYTSNNFLAAGNITADGNFYVHNAGPSEDSYIYFYEGTPTGKYLKWDHTDSRFEFNDTIYAPDIFAPTCHLTDVNAVNVISTNGSFTNLSSPTGVITNLTVTDLTITDDLIVNGHLSVDEYITANNSSITGKSLVALDDIYVNYNGGTDKHLYFHDGSSPDGEYLKYNTSSNEFAFSDPLYVSGQIHTNSSVIAQSAHQLHYNTILTNTEELELAGSGTMSHTGIFDSGLFIFSGADTFTAYVRVKRDSNATGCKVRLQITTTAFVDIYATEQAFSNTSYTYYTLTLSNLNSYLTIGTVYRVVLEGDWTTSSPASYSIYLDDFLVNEAA